MAQESNVSRPGWLINLWVLPSTHKDKKNLHIWKEANEIVTNNLFITDPAFPNSQEKHKPHADPLG